MKYLIWILILTSLFSTFVENTLSNSYSYRANLLDKEKKDIWSIAIPFIQKYEGLRLSAYKDHGKCSIGWGTRAKSCSEKIDLATAEKRFIEHIKPIVLEVISDFPNLHVEGQSALVSFRYNCPRGYQDVKKNGIKRHSLWCKKASGIVLPGLVKRRIEENKMIFINQ